MKLSPWIRTALLAGVVIACDRVAGAAPVDPYDTTPPAKQIVAQEQGGDAYVSTDDFAPLTISAAERAEIDAIAAESAEVTVQQEEAPAAVAAPLPPPVIAGAVMLAGNFVLVRVFKRKLV